MEPSEEEIKRWAAPDWRDPGQMSKDTHFRIGQLEGAIKGALPYFENMTDTAKTYATNLGAIYALGDVARAEDVIKALKELIGGEQ